MDNQKFRSLLDESYQWPDYYEFKFIIKSDDKSLILDKLVGFTIHETPSKKGNYTSVSARKLMKSTEEVLEIYQLMSTIKGVISL
jgi:putative lipoic acid-binding regulatory protein